MKQYFSFYLSIFILVSTTDTQAQLTIFAGPQMTSANYTIHGAKQVTEHKQGFVAGAGLKTQLEGPVYFSPMLSFTKKGYKVKFDRPAFPPDSAAVNNNTSINTIELAPLIQIDFSKKASHLFLRFGPAFDINLSGNEQFDTAANKQVNRKMIFSFGDYSHATISLNSHIGYQHKSGFTVVAHYNYGVSSLNNADLGPAIFHRAGGISLGWRFGTK